MCGIIAFVSTGTPLSRRAIIRGREAMAQRGPDACGEWWSDDGTTGLGHRRLSILDLSSRANQPLISADGRYVIALNGEIYNFRELRAELERDGAQLLTTSDTEVVLLLYARHGAAMLPRLRGMFALAIWDAVSRSLFVARDPYGIKPLYVARSPRGCLVASQVKAILATGLVSREPDPDGQAGFWLLGSVPEPHTWFRDISALPAGHHALITEQGMTHPTCWWDVAQAWRTADDDPDRVDGVPALSRAALLRSVAAHLVSDVPVGVFLSGGIDSGSVAALMLEAGARDLSGVTIAFEEFTGRREDETPRAVALARHYGIRHTVRVVRRAEFEEDLPRILSAMDQPSVDGINTWYAAKAVAEAGLKVVVSGVGGDELFQGYATFRTLPRLLTMRRAAGRVPGALSLARLFSRLQHRRTGNARWSELPRRAGSIEGAWLLSRGVLAEEEIASAMRSRGVSVPQSTGVALVRQMAGTVPCDPRLGLGMLESTAYLRNQLLRDSDWASMDHSVELRTPLVDAWLLRDLQPHLGSFHRFPRKALLANAPRPALPRELTTARKTGFGIPIAQWLSSVATPPFPRRGMAGVAEYVADNCY